MTEKGLPPNTEQLKAILEDMRTKGEILVTHADDGTKCEHSTICVDAKIIPIFEK